MGLGQRVTKLVLLTVLKLLAHYSGSGLYVCWRGNLQWKHFYLSVSNTQNKAKALHPAPLPPCPLTGKPGHLMKPPSPTLDLTAKEDGMYYKVVYVIVSCLHFGCVSSDEPSLGLNFS